jgi:hypothetical protein
MLSGRAVRCRLKPPNSINSTPQYQLVFGRRMAYLESGVADRIVLLHGNLTSSYLWHNFIPHRMSLGH